MRISYLASIKRKLIFLLMTVLSVTFLNAQITVTSPIPSSLTFNSATAPGSIVFGVKNTNAAPVTITEVGNYIQANFSGTLTLWYHPTAITGAPSAINTTNGWIQVATGAVTSSTTAGVRPVFKGLSLSIPANTTYRFAISGPANSPFYGGAGTTPNIYSAGGLEIYVQDNSNSPGYGGAFPGPPTNTPRSFLGSITFIPTTACTEPPVAGEAVALLKVACSGSNFNLNLVGGTIGTGQTYQWQRSTDNASWTNIGTASSNSLYSTSQTSSNYYRAAITCGASTVYSNSVRVITGPVAGTYTINSALPTDGSNFQNFTEAVEALKCGITGPVVFNVVTGSGPYNEQISIPAISGASATNTITFNGNGSIIQATPNDGARHIIRLDGADYITINNLKIVSQSATYGWGIHFINGADRNTINNCTIDVSSVTSITAANSGGIIASGSTTSVTTAGSASNNTISNNTIIGGYQGIVIYGATGSLNAVNNSITKNTIKDFYATGIELDNNDGTVIAFNDINRAGRIAVTTFSGIELGTGNKKCTINANRIHDTHTVASTQTGTAYGIYLTGCDAAVGSENKVTNNLIYNFNSGSGTIYGIYNSGSDGVHYFHNTVVLDFVGALSGITRGFYQTTAATNIQFKNNIISVARGGDGTKYCLYFGTTTSSIVSNKNVLINSSVEGTNGIGYRSSGYTTLSNWKTANSAAYDQQSISADPLFQNATTGNFKPLQASLDNIGDNVGVTKDVLDNSRAVSNPDPGAYEFDYSACSGTPAAGKAVSSLATVCVEPFTLSLIGASESAGITYQWQISTDNTTWKDIFDATTSGLTTTQTVTTYYRAMITCSNSGVTMPSESVMVTSPALVSGTFTIDSRVATGGTNFQSFNDAYNHIKCGINGPVVFNVVSGSGPYDEQLIMSPVPGTSATNTITFNGNGNTLSYLAKNTNERAVIKLYGVDYVTFDKLTITAKGSTSSDYGFGIQLLNDADFNTISNCIINIDTTSSSTNFAGIVVSNSPTSATGTGAAKCDNNTFSNNSINGGYYGLTIVGSSAEANGSNKIINNTIKEFYTYGIYVNGSFNTLIEGNTITRPDRSNVSTFYGIYFTSLSTKAHVTRNRITNPFGGAPTSTSDFYGIYFNSVATLATFENIVSNNLIYNLTGNGDAYGIYNSASSSAWYYHNTISMDGSATSSTDAEVTRGFYQTSTANGLEFKNNIITISRGGVSAKTAIFLNAAATTIVSDKNLYYISTTTGVRNIGYFNTAHPTLTQWRTATSNDLQSVSSNPIYKDSAAGNFAPQNAAIDNLGVTVGVSNDINNVSRSTSTPDIGAYEFTPEPCTGVPVAGTATISETPVCSETPVMLSVTGNSFGVGQTFQWQTSFTATGTYENLGGLLTTPDTVILAPTNTLYYRVAVTCGGQTSYSTPVLLTVTDPLAAGTYTINKNAPASASNFISFNAAKAAMGCGIAGPIVFNVEQGSGPYDEQLILGPIRGTSDLNTITFNGNGNTIKFSSSESEERAVIKLNGAKYITFDSLVIDATGSGSYGYGVQFINDADYNVVNNCTINLNKTSTLTNYGGIIISSLATSATDDNATLCDYNRLSNNTINGGYYGITVSSGTSPFVEYNVIRNNKVLDFYSYGIYLKGNSHTLIEGNELARPTRTNSTTTQAIYATDINEGLRISKNRIHNPFGSMTTSASGYYGIYFTGVDAPDDNENVVTNNLIYNFNGAGAAYGIYNSGSNNASYYHNTISMDVAASTTTSATYGFYQTGEAQGLDIKNNLVTITRGGTGNKFAMYFNNTATQFTSDYNNFFVSGTAAHVGYYAAANKTTLATWQASTGKDLTSSIVDPLYTSPATGNYKPNSPILDNRGTNVTISTDIEGVARNLSAPDIGAYEFNVPPCTAPPVGGTTKASPATGICMGTPVLLSLEGNTFGSGMSFQWEYATSASGTYSPLGAPKLFPDTLIQASSTLYYRAAVTCSGSTEYSTPVLVTINPAFLSGVYTIDPGQPVSTTNFQSFTTAVAALECGITGPVTFMVAPGTYTEQIRMKRISGTSGNSRVTFQSTNGNPSSVILTYGAKDDVKNYVLKLDSASFITYKDMTITAKDSVYGRVIELANTASNDSLVNLVINAPVNDTTATSVVGIYANSLKGGNHVIKDNTIRNGSNGIYFRGTSTTNPSARNTIDNNTITGAYNYGIYTYYTSRIKVVNNKVSATLPLNSTFYGIYNGYADTAYQVVGNMVDISNTTGSVYGIYNYYSDATAQERGRVANNTVLVTGNNTGTIYGLGNYYCTYNNTVNNVVSIHTTGTSSYALYSYQGGNNNYYNNSINSTATSATNNHAGYFYHTSGAVDVRNNIFSHNGGGRAFYTYNPDFTFSDYNMLYTNGAVLVQQGTPATNYADLKTWRNAYLLDLNSIVYKPAFISNTDLQPNVADSHVWAMHGRGVQIPGHDYDFNNNTRPTTLTAGVPDLGAYEFVPSVEPPVITPVPVAPAAGITQTFMFGTDTVSKITWAPGAPVPSTISMKRYSGITPPGLTSSTPHMYYYTDVQTTGTGTFNFAKKDFFVDSWQGFINHQYQIRLGRTNGTASWTVGVNSKVDTISNVITEENLAGLFQFTGLADVNALPPPPPVFTQQIDSSNMGKRFWVGYANSYDFNSNDQDMVLYLSTGAEPATVTVRVNGTGWTRTYTIPAFTAITSDKMPKAGLNDSRLTEEGLFTKGISIESDVPIVAYAHIYASTNSGATMLLPVGTYGYEYYTLNSKQTYSTTRAHSSFFVVADRDNTVVEITPSNPTAGGKAANVPFTVTLRRGEVYQVLGAYISGSEGYDLSGSKIKSIPNSDGKCYPIAVFAGSSRTRLACGTGTSGGGDLLFQQVFPSQAWGTRYLTAPTSIAATASSVQTNIYRVMVKDPNTKVLLNGADITTKATLVNNRYYQYESNTADYIQADKAIMVAQYMASSNSSCAGSTSYSDGDPELFYLSPLEQAIKSTVFYRNTVTAIRVNYLTLTIPTNGLGSLKVDGSNSFDHIYVHPNLTGYSVVVKRWGNTSGQSTIQSDSAFTGIVYGEGSQESYGYNVGTLVKNLNVLASITNTLSTTGGTNEFTCARAPFKVAILIPVMPNTLTWNFSQVSGIMPNADVTLTNPVPVSTVIVNNKTYYKYELSQDYVFNSIGTFNIPISYTHPEIEGCNNKLETILTVKVVPAPLTDFTVNYTNCIGDVAKFTGSGGTGVTVSKWEWSFGDGGTATDQSPTKQYAAAGSYDVNLKLLTPDGCLGETNKTVLVNNRPVITVVNDSLANCAGATVKLTVKDPVVGVTYNWFDASSGGTLKGTGEEITVTVNGSTEYYVEAVQNNCASSTRQKVKVHQLSVLPTPVVIVDSAGTDMLRFKWSAVPGATGYEVWTSRNSTWVTPSSGSNGLTHSITGLHPLDTVRLIVRVKGGCLDVQSLAVTGKAFIDQIFVPNSFSPNGDGLNDVLQVYGDVIKEIQFMVFNQWGERIYESRDLKRAWDGTSKGKLQPSGVYMYVSKLILNDGSVIQKKGSINLIR